MSNLQILSLLAWLSLGAYCVTIQLPTSSSIIASNPTAICNPTADDLDNMLAGYTSACTFNCHLDTWESSRCSLGADCGCENCLSLDHACLCNTNEYILAVFECIGIKCTQSEQIDAAAVAAGCSAYANSQQAVIDISMAYAAASSSLKASSQASVLSAQASKSTTPSVLTTARSQTTSSLSSTSMAGTQTAPGKQTSSANTSSTSSATSRGSSGLTTQQIDIEILIPVVIGVVGIVITTVSTVFGMISYRGWKKEREEKRRWRAQEGR